MKVNIGYAWRQLLGARRTAAEHEDEDVRARAAKNVAKWEAVIAGMQAGTIDIGSRTPTKAPAWVTLDVVTGGFATGAYAAGGPLQPHEVALCDRLGVRPSRAAANIHHVDAPEASELLASGRYRIEVPEEGALLVAAWLRERGEIEKAAQLVEHLAPWFETLRFFPAPSATPIELRETVRLQDVGTAVEALDTGRRQARLDTQRAAELVWKPLRERAIALWIETVEGEVPRVVDGRVTGGAVARRFPEGWRAWVHALVADCRQETAAKTRRAYDVIHIVELLARLATHPNALDAHALAAVRNEVAWFVTAHGVPGTGAFTARREMERAAVAGPLHADLRRVLVDRLRRAGGISDLEGVAAPVTREEAGRFAVPAGSAIPAYMIDKAARCWDAPLEALLARRVIGSAEVLARVLPQLTAHVRAETLPDDAGRRLYAAMYMAFRRRRSLLLLDYAHQVRFHELPWVAAMETRTSANAARARHTLARAAAAALRAFPYTITPNKLVTELGALASAAGVELPLVEELAADIFMGSFTPKFAAAATISGDLLAGTLYQRYYGIAPQQFAALAAANGKRADDFAALCRARAGTTSQSSSVASNGKIIEQAQILTTHNLGVLFARLALRDTFAPDLRPAAEHCFRWIVRQLRMLAPSYHCELTRLKNTAYAWRQLIFFLSFTHDAATFPPWARAQLARLPSAALRARFEPALRGLELAIAGIPSTSRAFAASGGRVFTGWATERHWLAAR